MRRPPSLSTLPKYPVTGGVALLALVVTVVSFAPLSRDVSPLYESPLIGSGELWRLVTSALPHANLIHLAFNLYWLWTFGTLIEDIFGSIALLTIILGFAAGSGSAEYAILDGGIGLSGVVYGLWGMMLILSPRDPRFQDAVDTSTNRAFVAWFFLCILTTVTGILLVANIAHFIGAVLGIFLGFAIARRGQRAAWSIGFGALISAAIALAVIGRPWVNLSTHRGDEEFNLGAEALLANRDRDALPWCRRSVRLNPKQSRNWYNFGIALERAGDATGASDAFRNASKLDPGNEQYKLIYESHTPTSQPH